MSELNKELYQKKKELEELCSKVGHEFVTYTVSTSAYYICSSNIEQAGYCKVCGYDTHKKYWE